MSDASQPGTAWDDIIDAWKKAAPWSNPQHVVQDLVLSRAIVEFSNDPQMSRRVVLHGGTCLHKVWHDRALRYSEDLDFLCVKPWHLLSAMRRAKRLLRAAGVTGVRYSFLGYPALHASKVDGRDIALKIDFNPTPRAARRAARNRAVRGSLAVDSPWFRGDTTGIRCVSPTDILASKIAAIMARSKPRDLADLCTGIDSGLADIDDIVDVYVRHYRSGEHPRSLRERLETLDCDDAYMAEAADSGDFAPKHFSQAMRDRVVGDVDQVIALHLSRTRPAKLSQKSETSAAVLERARSTAGAARSRLLCRKVVGSTGRRCYLKRGHRGRCRSR